MSNLVDDPTGDLTYRIIGAAMSVHNRIGPGYKEEVYENALFAELQRSEIPAEHQFPISVFDGPNQVGLFYLDLFVYGQVVVEAKAFSHSLTNDELAQVID
jgi:GxxExxY protein